MFSGKDSHFKSLDVPFTAVVLSNGSVLAESKDIEFSTWCSNAEKNWPNDRLECDILIALDGSYNFLLELFNQSVSSIFKVN